MRAAALLVLFAAHAVAAPPGPPAYDPLATQAWSAVQGDGCASLDAGSGATALRFEPRALASCYLPVESPARLAGHGVHVTASNHAQGLRDADVVLMLTQFRGDTLRGHRYVTASLRDGGVATLDLRCYVLPDSDRVVIGLQVASGDGTVEARDLALGATREAMPPGAMSDAARAYLDDALKTIFAQSVALDRTQVPALRSEALALATGATTASDVQGAIRQVLTRIGDGHSRLLAASEATVWASDRPRPPYGIERSTLDRTTGYLRIRAFNALSPSERHAYADYLAWSLRAALADANGAGLVIDLRDDEGGSFGAMLDGLCDLFDRDVSLGSFDGRDGRRQSWHCRSTRVRSSAQRVPIAVLIGPRTASAGEMLAIALKDRSRTVLIGADTRGLTTGIHLSRLRDGALLALATSITVDRHGTPHPHGVVPALPVADDAEASNAPGDASIVSARAWIDAHR